MGKNSAPLARISVAIADAARMSCDLLSFAVEHLTRDISVVAAVTDLREVLEVVGLQSVDVVIVRADLQDGSAGVLLIRQLREKYPKVRCVMLIDDRSRHLVVDAFRAGTHGIVFLSDPVERLFDCIRGVYRGQIWASSSEIEQIIAALSTAVPVRTVSAQGMELLTERQRQLVALVGQGLSNRDISQRLGLSEHTVKNYMFRIFDKLGVSSRAELIIYALHRQDRAA